jgi:hypothetical protein
MLEHRACIEQDLERDHGSRTRADRRDHRAFVRRRDSDLEWMESQTRRHVEIRVRMVDAMDAPQHGHGVEDQMLRVDREVQDNDRAHDPDPRRERQRREQPPVVSLRRDRDSDLGARHDKHQQQVVERGKCQILRPSHDALETPVAPRSDRLPKRDRREYDYERGEAQRRFVGDKFLQDVLRARATRVDASS